MDTARINQCANCANFANQKELLKNLLSPERVIQKNLRQRFENSFELAQKGAYL